MIPVVRYSDWRERSVLSADAEVVESVSQILRAVSENGDAALRYYTLRFDGLELSQFSVPEKILATAFAQSSPAWQRRLKAAEENIRRFHERQRQKTWYMDDGDGVRLGQRVVPIRRAGLYVPGGSAAYPSSVLMNAIPAQVAGVNELVLASPPTESGWPHPEILAAAYMVGVPTVYAVGGAQAIAALAYGTETIRPVHKIVGPGSAFVTEAKKQVYGVVGIDSLAGPSEVVVLADTSANPEWVAADMLAQAEHDPRARAILVTPDSHLAGSVQKWIQEKVPLHPREDILIPALRDHGACIITQDLPEAIMAVNKLAPEHLELLVEDPWGILESINHAGAVFIGPWSPESVGDYFAGPNHVLPTTGAARFSSALSVDDFIRKQSVISYSKRRLKKTARDIAALARSEMLEAHAQAVEIRAGEECRK